MINRYPLAALAAVFMLAGCANSPAHRINECEANGGSEADCIAAERQHEKEHPFATDNNMINNAAALQAALAASMAKPRNKE